MDSAARMRTEMKWHGRGCAVVILTGWMLSVAAMPQDPPGSRMGLPQSPREHAVALETLPAPSAPPVPPPPAAALPEPRKDRRDPFLRPNIDAPGLVHCAGKSCLVVDDLTVRGVVRSPARNFGIVVDGAGRVYFLGEKESVRGGVVERIAADGIVFRMQAAGKAVQHVLRRLANVSETP